MQRAIKSGALPYLRNRRNKQAVTGNIVPDDYLSDKKLAQAAQVLKQLASRLSKQGQMLLLLELYLVLLKDKGLIPAEVGS